MTIVTNKKKVTTSHFHLFSFFYHLSDLLFFLSFLCLVDIFLWKLLIFVIFFCLMNVLLLDLLLLYDEIGWIEVFFSDLVFDVYFVFICSFLLVDVLLWDFSAPLQIQQSNNFSFSLFSFFYHLIISIFDEMLDCYFLSQSFFITFMNKKQVKSSHLFSFFYHLLRSTFFSIIFVFDGYFSLRSTYFCSNNLFDESFAYRSTFLCCRHWLDRALFFLRYVVRWICFTHI